MRHLIRDFISEESRNYKFKLGELVASALSGFVVGVVVASIVWMLAFYYINDILLATNDAPFASQMHAGRDDVDLEGMMESADGAQGQTMMKSTKVRVISPNGGEIWESGQDYNIRWEFKDLPLNTPVSAVLIRTNSIITNPYTKNSGRISGQEMFYSAMFPQRQLKDGSYTYRLPDTLAPGTYQVLVYGGANCASVSSWCEYDLSDKLFTIK